MRSVPFRTCWAQVVNRSISRMEAEKSVCLVVSKCRIQNCTGAGICSFYVSRAFSPMFCSLWWILAFASWNSSNPVTRASVSCCVCYCRRLSEPLTGLTNVQLTEHYTNCIKLSAENVSQWPVAGTSRVWCLMSMCRELLGTLCWRVGNYAHTAGTTLLRKLLWFARYRKSPPRMRSAFTWSTTCRSCWRRKKWTTSRHEHTNSVYA